MTFESSDYRTDSSGLTVAVFVQQLPTSVGVVEIDALKELSEARDGENVRLCLHNDSDALFHSMIVLENQGTYGRPHKHIDKGECFHLIAGEMAVFSFDEKGTVTDCCHLQLDGTFMYRVAPGTYHMVIPLTSVVIYHESKIGPFVKGADSVFGSWSPDGSDVRESQQYCAQLLGELV